MSDLTTLRQQLAAQTAEVDKYVMDMANASTPDAQKTAQQAMEAAQTKVHDLEKQVADAAAKAKEQAATEAASLEHAVGEEATPATSSGLRAGETAYVQQAGGKGLRRRSAPSLSSEVLDAFAPGTALTLLDGPTEADGHHWWRVQATDGREGWVAGEELVLNAG